MNTGLQRVSARRPGEVRRGCLRGHRQRWALLGAVGLLVAGAAGSGADGLSPASAPMSEVFQVPRPAEGDQVVLRDGEQLTGIVLNETLSLRAAYGSLALPVARLAGVQASEASSDLVVMRAVNQNRFSGFLGDDPILFRPQEGTQRSIRPESLQRIVFGRRPAELEGLRRGQLVSLKNGDSFTGTLSGGPFPLATATGTETVAVEELEAVTFVDGRPPSARVRLRNGRALEGTWPTDDLEVELDLGPRLRLHRGRVAIVYGPAGVAPAGAADPSQAAAPAGMVWVPPGGFTLGSPVEEVGRDLDEGPQTQMSLTHGFWMGTHEVTQAEYREVMETNPSQFLGDNRRPVENVSWREAMTYCDRLNQLQSARGTLPEGYVYRLPSEAEWEYACRAGTTTRFGHGDDPDGRQLEGYGWFSVNSESSTHPVGTKRANAWGLFDMHGNVLEWCLDASSGSLPGGRVTNYVASAGGSLRVARGGSWLYGEKFCRSANRDAYGESTRCSDLGFRVMLAPRKP